MAKQTSVTTVEHEVDDLGALYAEYGGALHQLCARRLGRTADAEDAAQEALLKAADALHRFDRSRPLWPWLATIAINTCTDLQRQQATRRRRPVPMDLPPPDPDDLLLRRVHDQLVRDAVEHLPPASREALLLRDVEGWEYGRIGRHQQRSPGATRTAVTRARQELRGHLERLARARGQWPLTGLAGGAWLRVRRRGTRLAATVSDLPEHTAQRYDIAWGGFASMATSVLAQAAVGAVLLHGALTGPSTTPGAPDRATAAATAPDAADESQVGGRPGDGPAPPSGGSSAVPGDGQPAEEPQLAADPLLTELPVGVDLLDRTPSLPDPSLPDPSELTVARPAQVPVSTLPEGPGIEAAAPLSNRLDQVAAFPVG